MKPYKVTETRQVTYMVHSPGEAEIREYAANVANSQGHELLSVDVSEIIDVESWEGSVQQLSLFDAEQAWEDYFSGR